MSTLQSPRKDLIAQYRINEKDTGSSEVQIALLSKRIQELTEHLKIHSKDNSSKRGLLALVIRRRKLLAYLQRTKLGAYLELTTSLGLRQSKTYRSK